MKVLLDDQADAVFQALADRTRRDIVRRVLVEALSVSELAAEYEMSFAAVQKHVAVLERAGLISKQRVGREQRAHAEVSSIRSVRDMLDELEGLWRSRVRRIDALLAGEGPTTLGRSEAADDNR
ncbi:ArsR/SmtB family transcription factor [Brevibacterium sp. GP-SGM9]|uniref:ArsR/SmtB family transcription factor n=1 Tax=unclassified Brevibacterium TaxID=2614124 RepID=UPI001E520815|nr:MULTISPECIES: metalloregulator ArsR/SmtB family transcription factor [unclassified Brevibacterium]MCD1286656.1 transcriptional regulator [Brevibacterium sp. CCUG 69071]MDK8434114.1 metalloregulator ArsR/SmtB family transcription factor [Brevibacterium sp. H-BE7]